MNENTSNQTDPQEEASESRINEFVRQHDELINHSPEHGALFTSPTRYFLALAAFLRDARSKLDAREYLTLKYRIGVAERISAPLRDLIEDSQHDESLKAAVDLLDNAIEAILKLPGELQGFPVLDFRWFQHIFLMYWGSNYPNLTRMPADPFDKSEEEFVEDRLEHLETLHMDLCPAEGCGDMSCTKCYSREAAV